MSEHTPGPWSAGQTTDSGDANALFLDPVRIIWGGYREKDLICMAAHCGGAVEANAAMLAAAPDLLEALEAILVTPSGSWHDKTEAFNKGVAAVRKARGQSTSSR